MRLREYATDAARVVFNDPTWWWRGVVLALVGFVPVVGSFALIGYYMVLMRDVAWGVDRGLPPFSEIGQISRRAVDGFLIALVWGLVLTVPMSVFAVAWSLLNFTAILSGEAPSLPAGFTPFLWALVLLVAIPLNIGCLRAAMYLNARAGLSFNGVMSLIRRDREGFWTVTAFAAMVSLSSVVLGLPSTHIADLTVLSSAWGPAAAYGWRLIVDVACAPLFLMTYAAYGLWARGTDPASWGQVVVVSNQGMERTASALD